MTLATPAQARVPQASEVQDDVSQVPESNLVKRRIPLTELGFERGIEMEGLSGFRELFFPVPRADSVQGLRLILPYRSDAAFESRRSIQVEVDGSPVLTTALPNSTHAGTIDIPIDASSIREDYLRIGLRYSGAITEDRCVDERVSGAYLSFEPEGALVASIERDSLDSVGDVAAIMPKTMDIVLPENISEAHAAAALTLAAGYDLARITAGQPEAYEDEWTRSRMLIAGTDASALAVDKESEQPEIRIGGDDPAAAARLLRSQWNLLASKGTVRSAKAEKSRRERLTFADLGGDTSVQRISNRGSWTVPLPLTALEPGETPSGLAVDVAVADDGSVTSPVVSVLMNGVLLGSAKAVRGERTRVSVDLPEGLIAASNSIEVAVTRQVRAGDCAYAPQAYEAQLLPSSHVKLGAAGRPVDFSDLAPAFADGVTVVMPGPDALGGVRRLVSTLVDGQTPIRVSYGDIPEDGPYVLVSDSPPPGTDPSVRIEGETVPFIGIDGRNLIDSEAMSIFTIAQLVSDGGRTALWIRPGVDFASGVSAGKPVSLGRGDVAFIDGNGIELAFSTERDRLVDISYPDETSFLELLKRYWLWLVVIGWLLASAGFVYLLRSVYKSRKPGG